MFLVATVLLAFPLKASTAVEPTIDQVDFFRTPLVCPAAPEIGCGSRAKPLLIELEKNSAVESAWLDRAGNHIAIVWKNGSLDRKQRTKAMKGPFAQYDIPIDAVADADEKTRLFADYNGGGRWYRGAEVDALSLEESGVLADRIVQQLLDAKKLDPQRAGDLRGDLLAYFKVELVKLRTKEELFGEAGQTRFRADIRTIGEKYVGVGNMPELELRSSKAQGCETGEKKKDCCKGKSSSCQH